MFDEPRKRECPADIRQYILAVEALKYKYDLISKRVGSACQAVLNSSLDEIVSRWKSSKVNGLRKKKEALKYKTRSDFEKDQKVAYGAVWKRVTPYI